MLNAAEPLSEHRVDGVAVLPGAWFVAELLARDLHIVGVRFERPVLVDQLRACSIVLGEGRADLLDPDGARVARACTGVPDAGTDARESPPRTEPVALGSRGPILEGESMYDAMARRGNDFGPGFRTIQTIAVSGDAVEADLRSGAGASRLLLIDACAQAASLLLAPNRLFVLQSLGNVRWFGPAAGAVRSLDKQPLRLVGRRASGDGEPAVTCQVVTAQGTPVLEVESVRLDSPRSGGGEHATAESVVRTAVAGTFTLDPLQEVAAFWRQRHGLPAEMILADFGQVLPAVLDPNGAFGGRATSNTCLIRLSDWCDPLAAPPAARGDPLPGSVTTWALPDGRSVASLNDYETAYLHQEIFRDLAYRRHGIRVLEDDLVIDIGANIGLFSLFVAGEAERVRTIAIEPSPMVLPILRANLAHYLPESVVVPAGASDRIGTAQFTAYPNSSVFSTFDSDVEADGAAIRQVIENTLRAGGHDSEELIREAAEGLLRSRTDASRYECDLVTVSSVIREHDVGRIGLLKIDAEKSEDAILAGIDEAHWPLIDQLVVEVHLQGGRSDAQLISDLERRGFEVHRDEEQLLADSGLIGLYAVRPERRARNARRARGDLETRCAEFVEALRSREARSSTPMLVVLCPEDLRDATTLARVDGAASALRESVAELPATRIVGAAELLEHCPVPQPHDPTRAELANIPYTDDWYAAVGSTLLKRDLVATRPPVKVLVLDCDNTLWSGVVGEDGVAGIRFGPGHRALHEMVRRFRSEGVLIALASKNDVEDVRAVFEERTDFDLRWDDITAARVNWKDKPDNLRSLADELGLGLDSFVFLDDSPIECARVRAELPAVLALQLPADDAELSAFVSNLRMLRSGEVITAEDRRRAELYREEGARRATLAQAVSYESFLRDLDLKVDIEALNASTSARASQMTQRTNQFNTTTIRRGELDLLRDAGAGLHVAVARVRDRFGDYGITGLIAWRPEKDGLHVESLLLSCRVLGRGVEHALVRHAGEAARQHDIDALRLSFLPSERNEPARKFLSSIGGTIREGADGFDVLLSGDEARGLPLVPVEDTEADATAREGEAGSRAMAPAPAVPSELWQRIIEAPVDAASLARGVTRLRQPVARPDVGVAWRAPASEEEKLVAGVWEELLNVAGIGADDDFFALGGTSLKAVQMAALLRDRHGIKVSVVQVFDTPTVAKLATDREAGETPAAVAEGRQSGAARRARRPPPRRRETGR